MDEVEALRALAVRLIPGVAPWGQFGRPTVLRPAALPPDVPEELPLPGRLIGSCASGTFSLILLDTEQTPQAVLQFYERELGARGWYRHDTQGPGGFLPPGNHAPTWVLFCRSAQGPSLRIGAIPRVRTGTELQLQLETDPQRTPCARPPGLRPRHGRRGHFAIPLPPLAAPPGATMQSFGHGGGSGSYQATATMQSDLELSRLADHFAGVLEEADWTQRRAGGTGPVAWSSWTCRNEHGEQVDGFFLAFRQSDHLYALQLERDVSPDSRRKAEAQSREQARTMKRAVSGEYAARVEIEGAAGGDSARALHELILRIVAPPDPGMQGYENPQLHVGRLPDAMPAELPLPPATRVLGALELSTRTMIYLESRTLPRQILAFYRERLPAYGWTFFGEERSHGGFTFSWAPEQASCLFCPAAEGPALALVAHVMRSDVTDLRLTLVTELSQTPCAGGSHPSKWVYRSQQPQLPALAAPAESDFAGGGGSGWELHWESRAYVYTSMDLRAVAEHYGRQLQAAGWERRGSGRDDLVAWSIWSKLDDEGEPIDAIALAMRYPGSEGYSLLVGASRPVSQPHP